MLGRWFRRALLAVLTSALAGASVVLAAPRYEETFVLDLPLVRIGTAGQSRCGETLAAPGTACLGFDAQDVRALQDLWVVGYENNRAENQKHVLQTVAVVDLAPLRSLEGQVTVTKAVLGYTEASTTRRSAAGESDYGILPTCNTGLGVPTDAWTGGLDRVIPTQPAAIAGVTPATTAEAGAWDVTPQVAEWLAGSGTQHALVLRGDDESLDVNEQQMCLSYVFGLGLTAEVTVAN